MTTDQIRTLFGKPDKVFAAVFGEETDELWDGIVWEYYVVEDTSFHYMTRYRTNTFVFVKDLDPPVLNNWIIEHTGGPE